MHPLITDNFSKEGVDMIVKFLHGGMDRFNFALKVQKFIIAPEFDIHSFLVKIEKSSLSLHYDPKTKEIQAIHPTTKKVFESKKLLPIDSVSENMDAIRAKWQDKEFWAIRLPLSGTKKTGKTIKGRVFE